MKNTPPEILAKPVEGLRRFEEQKCLFCTNLDKHFLKYSHCVGILLLLTSASFAQTTIPDPNFAAAIRAACPTCIDASNRLLEPATTLTELNVSNKNIADLTGVEGFTGLTNLICNANNLTSLPTLPNSLTILACSVNNLTSLPTLPNNLTFLNCSVNNLTSLPTLPNGLTLLYCFSNNLTSLPALPNSLQDLFCYNNQLTDLPTLPNSLLSLNIGSNRLTTLPTLPSSLQYLYCFNNQLRVLPALPNKITDLRCGDNNLSVLPTLPDVLTTLWCTPLSALSCLPKLPNSLKELKLDAIKITCLPNEITGLVVYGNTVINANPIPTPPVCTNPIATLTGTQTINAGQTANLTITLTGTGPWDIVMNGKTYTATASPYSITVTPTATTTYTLTSVKTACNTGTVIGEAVVTVNQCINLPTIGISTGGKLVICGGNPLKISSTGGAEGYTYQWRKDNVNFGSNTADIDVTEAGRYSLKATDSKGCAVSSGTINISKSSTTVTLSGKNIFCLGTTTTLTATVQNATGALQYQWKVDGKNVGDGKNTWAASQEGNYTIEITDANGCKATSTVLDVTEKGGELIAQITPQGPLSVYAPEKVLLVATLGKEYQYQWKRDNANIAGANGGAYTAEQSGSYTVIVSRGECSRTSAAIAVKVEVPLSVVQPIHELFQLMPNPTNGWLTLKTNGQNRSTLLLKLLDVQGRVLQVAVWPTHVSEYVFDMRAYLAGVYLLHIEHKDSLQIRKIIKNQ